MTAFTKADALELFREAVIAYGGQVIEGGETEYHAATVLHDRFNEIVEARLAEVGEAYRKLYDEGNRTLTDLQAKLDDARDALNRIAGGVTNSMGRQRPLLGKAAQAIARTALQKDQTNG